MSHRYALKKSLLFHFFVELVELFWHLFYGLDISYNLTFEHSGVILSLPHPSLLPPFCIMYPHFSILYLVSCILYPVSCILYPVSCILYPVSCILYLVSCILYFASCILYPVSCIMYPLFCILYPASCIPPPIFLVHSFTYKMVSWVSWERYPGNLDTTVRFSGNILYTSPGLDRTRMLKPGKYNDTKKNRNNSRLCVFWTRHILFFKSTLKPELGTFEWWISGLMLDPLFFLISSLNNACSLLLINFPIR